MRIFVLYEESYLVLADDDVTRSSNGKVAPLSKADFAFFEHKASNKSALWIKRDEYQRKKALRIKNYAGNVLYRGNTCFEILPKTAAFSGDEAARRLFVRMLSALPGFQSLERDRALATAAHGTLLDVFIQEFLHSVRTVLQHGLRNHFTEEESNQYFYRGKLKVSEHIRLNSAAQHKFFTAHEEFLADRPENKLLKSALLVVKSWKQRPRFTEEATQMLSRFDEVPASTDYAADFHKIPKDRNTLYYAAALNWAKVILFSQAPAPSPRNIEIPVLLFPMQELFEAYVARMLQRALRRFPQFMVATQVAHHPLVRHGSETWFRLRPDIVIYDRFQSRRPVMILDTKWKLLDSSSQSRQFNLSQSDFQQLLCYGLTYLKGEGRMALLYPSTPQFPQNCQVCTYPFEAAEKLELHIEGFDLERQFLGSCPLEEKLLDWLCPTLTKEEGK